MHSFSYLIPGTADMSDHCRDFLGMEVEIPKVLNEEQVTVVVAGQARWSRKPLKAGVTLDGAEVASARRTTRSRCKMINRPSISEHLDR